MCFTSVSKRVLLQSSLCENMFNVHENERAVEGIVCTICFSPRFVLTTRQKATRKLPLFSCESYLATDRDDVTSLRVILCLGYFSTG